MHSNVKHNNKEVVRLEKAIKASGRAVSVLIATQAMERVMMPNHGEFSASSSRMQHSSSNAAWNWRIGIGGKTEAPLMDQGKRPVGDAWDLRSQFDVGEAEATVEVRVNKDITQKLVPEMFKFLRGKAVTFSMYNTVDEMPRFGYRYADNANISAAHSKTMSHLSTYEAKSSQYVESMISALGSDVSAEWIKQQTAYAIGTKTF